MVIERALERLPHCVDLSKVDAPAKIWIHGTFNGYVDAVAVSVHPSTFVARWHVRKLVGGFEIVRPNETNLHANAFSSKTRRAQKSPVEWSR